MIVFSCLSCYDSHKDRYNMFYTMAREEVKVKVLLLHGEHPALQANKYFEQLSLPNGTNFFSRAKYIKEFISKLPKDECIIFHDTALSQLGINYKEWNLFHRRKNVRLVLGLYFEHPLFFFKGHWKGYNKKYKTTLSEYPYFIKTYLSSVIMEAISCHISDGIIGNSEQIIEGICKYYKISKEKTRYIASEVDVDFYCPGDSQHKKLNLSDKDINILYVGKMQRHKGIDLLMDAFDLLYKKRSNVRLILVGPNGDTGFPWYRDLHKNLMCSSKIEFRDKVDSETLRDYYRTCDMLVMPTHNEGSPRAIKEALASGCLVVASRINGNYCIDAKGESIVYASDWDPYVYSQITDRMIEDKTEKSIRIEKGIRLAHYISCENVANNYMKFYKDIL